MPIITIECPSCKGTGIYAGAAERDGAGVQCFICNGTGKTTYSYEEFMERKKRKDIVQVVERNPGIMISPEIPMGGMSYDDWFAGKPFEHGMEMREYTCPFWWSRQKISTSRCDDGSMLGCRYSDCKFFHDKAKCWEEYDKVKESK